MAYGVDSSRFSENKRAVEDKYIGPLVKTIMTRCIHCTRCVRFSTEVAGVTDLGMTGRGEDAEITTYLESAMTSELQGNVIDLCPVGALTSKPYAFKARPWELTKTEGVDVMDAVGSAIRIDTRGREVMRIMPRLNEAVNEEWISDKTRFIWDGLGAQRLDRPYIREGGKLRAASWQEAFQLIAERIKANTPAHVGAIGGDLASVEDQFALKSLMQAIGSPNYDCRQDGTVLNPDDGRASYLFNTTIEGIEEADALLIVGSNPRHEAAVLNARIRKRWRMGDFPIGLIGEQKDLAYEYDYLGAGPDSLKDLVNGKSDFAKILRDAKKPMILIGQGALTRQDSTGILGAVAKLAVETGVVAEGWNGFSVLHTAASRVGGLDIGFVPEDGGLTTSQMLAAAGKGELLTLFLAGADEIDLEAIGSAFVVYVGTHGDKAAHRADVILPAATYTEKSGTYVNTEGRVQYTPRAAFPPGEAREDWAIYRALSDVLGSPIAFDSLEQLRARLYSEFSHLAAIDEVALKESGQIEKLAKKTGAIKSDAFVSPISDFYLTNPIARASKVMAECSQLALGQHVEAAE